MTVADLIKNALRTLGVLAAGEAPEASEQADALVALNDMIDSWANERLLLYANLRNTYQLIAGHNPHTIGAGGDINTTRPVHIDRASILPASAPATEFPLTILSEAEWQNIPNKASTGLSVYMRVATIYPLAHIGLNPVPATADVLVLYTREQLGRFAATSSTVDLPPGYARALRFNLAKELAPEYGVSISQEAAETAAEAKAYIKRINYKPDYLRSDPAVLRGGPFNIISGDKG